VFRRGKLIIIDLSLFFFFVELRQDICEAAEGGMLLLSDAGALADDRCHTI